MHYWEMEGEGDSLHVLDLASDAVSYSSKEVAGRSHGSLEEQASAALPVWKAVPVLCMARRRELVAALGLCHTSGELRR